MRLKKVELINFKRFTHLTIDAIPESAKLVLLIGSNGSGKSSVFDGFESVKRGLTSSTEYYSKTKGKSIESNFYFQDNSYIERKDNRGKQSDNFSDLYKIFYGRQSLRIQPRITNKAFNIKSFERGYDGKPLFIDFDDRFIDDVYKYTSDLNKALRDPIFQQKDVDVKKIYNEFIEPFNKSLANVFGNDENKTIRLIQFEDASTDKPPNLIFQKGNSTLSYELLSHGEKQVIVILINFIVRNKIYQDTIYFIDEMDVHINTKLQYNLLKEITENWIPENCQLWTATHSLGFIQYAKDTAHSAIIDFDDLDFDVPQTLVPEVKENSNLYNIAVDPEFLPALFKDYIIYFVENKDKVYFANLKVENVVFVSENNRNNVFHKTINTQYKGIVDRDFLTDNDINEIRNQYKNLYVLNYYSIENYLFHPDNIEEYYLSINKEFNKASYIQKINECKLSVLDNLKIKLQSSRASYPYFFEPEFNGSANQNRFKIKGENEAECNTLIEYLNSNEFEIFYKVFPMKDYSGSIEEKQNIPKIELSKTNWFKNKITELLNK